LNLFLAVLLAAATVGGNTESKWTVTHGKTTVGTVTLLTSSFGAARAEWRANSKTTVFLLGNGKTWLRETGGDVDISTFKPTAPEHTIVPALLRVDPTKETKVTIDSYIATRTSLTSSNADASNFAIRPKKGAASRLARLSGDLLGPSDTSVAATAGGRGVGTKGLKLNDGGDYGAVANLENRDAAWKDKLGTALDEFQKEGKVGKARENQ
ncbi:MAG TPA: hypothetical protein VJ853_03305, partial [Thermoanaerobaculia bacterium]|nr:hypothetical protein [Thermoanaerobaculia bacterium]